MRLGKITPPCLLCLTGTALVVGLVAIANAAHVIVQQPLGPGETDTQQYPESAYGKDAGAILFRTSVDEREYRLGDPICLRAEMENPTTQPYSLILTGLPSAWSPTMGFGVRLTRNRVAIVDFPPSGTYVGSYSAPPFETLKPGSVIKSAVCFQDFASGFDLPLPEGEYELTIAFDSSKFPGINAGGIHLVHRWNAKPIHFQIRGAARTDAHEILSVIGREAGIPHLESDLISQDNERRQRAWNVVEVFGDSRLRDYFDKLRQDRPDIAAHSWWAGSDLRQFRRHYEN